MWRAGPFLMLANMQYMIIIVYAVIYFFNNIENIHNNIKLQEELT